MQKCCSIHCVGCVQWSIYNLIAFGTCWWAGNAISSVHPRCANLEAISNQMLDNPNVSCSSFSCLLRQCVQGENGCCWPSYANALQGNCSTAVTVDCNSCFSNKEKERQAYFIHVFDSSLFNPYADTFAWITGMNCCTLCGSRDWVRCIEHLIASNLRTLETLLTCASLVGFRFSASLCISKRRSTLMSLIETLFEV